MKHVGTGKDMIRDSPFVYPLFSQSSCILDAKQSILQKKKNTHIHRIKEHNSWNVSELEPQESVCFRRLRKNSQMFSSLCESYNRTLQVHLLSFSEHLIASATASTAGMVVSVPCLEITHTSNTWPCNMFHYMTHITTIQAKICGHSTYVSLPQTVASKLEAHKYIGYHCEM